MFANLIKTYSCTFSTFWYLREILFFNFYYYYFEYPALHTDAIGWIPRGTRLSRFLTILLLMSCLMSEIVYYSQLYIYAYSENYAIGVWFIYICIYAHNVIVDGFHCSTNALNIGTHWLINSVTLFSPQPLLCSKAERFRLFTCNIIIVAQYYNIQNNPFPLTHTYIQIRSQFSST